MAAQREDPTSMLSLYRRLIWYRKGSAALRWGDYRSLADTPDGVFAFVRQAGNDQLLVALNFTGDQVKLSGTGLPQEEGRLEVSTHPGRELGPVALSRLRLAGDEGVIVRLARLMS